MQPPSLGHRGQHPVAAAIAAMVLALLVASASAQRQFDELRKRGLPGDRDDTQAVALGDVDGDGDLDMVCGNEGQNRLYVNNGRGTLTDVTSGRMPVGSEVTHAVALRDVDGDGDLDLVCGNAGQNRLYLNNGSGTFSDATAARIPVDSDVTNSLALGDVDADGDLDLVCGNGRYPGRQNRLYLNDGSGTFTDGTGGRMPVDGDMTQAVALGDVDGDGDLDLVCGNGSTVGEQNRLYLNNGSGTFTDATAARMPFVSDGTCAVSLGDVDGDGDLDMVCGNFPAQLTPGQNRLYLNNGSGTFTDATAGRMPVGYDETTAVALGDVDGDGDLDLVCGNGRYPGQQNRLYLNNGSGTFTDTTVARVPVDNDETIALALGDVDGDGDLDMVCGNGGYSGQQNRLYLNGGSGTFADATVARMPVDPDSTRAVALGDVDGDGDLDMVCGNDGNPGQQNRLHLNNGSGTFTDATTARMPVDTDWTFAVTLGDVDGDGDLDLVCGNMGQNRLYLNNGSGTFTDATATHMPVDNACTNAVALGDVDGDGDLDLVCGNSCFLVYQDRLYLNNGIGTFTDATVARMPVDLDFTNAVALGDLDGDGDLDLVCGNGWSPGQQNRLYLNNGSGTFTDATAARMPVDSDRTLALALGDFDGDGDLDMVCGNASNQGQQNRLYLNNGSGVFTDATAARMPVNSDWTYAVALGDVDRDGDLDIVCGNEPQDRLYLNNGSGTFIDATAARMPVDSDWTLAVTFGDVDGDVDLDIVCGNAGQNRVYLNLQRQLDVPFVPGIGKPYTLEAYVRYGPTSAVDFAAPFLSAVSVAFPWPPFGTLRLDPTRSVALLAIAIPRPDGVGAVSFTIPDVPALAGIALYSQAMLLSPPFPALLTNGTADVILR